MTEDYEAYKEMKGIVTEDDGFGDW
jgi:hypothetical protein